MQDGAAEAVQAGDDQGVAGAQVSQRLVELWSAGFGPAGVVEVDICRFRASAVQGVGLVVGVLIGGGDSRVAQQHLSDTGADVYRR